MLRLGLTLYLTHTDCSFPGEDPAVKPALTFNNPHSSEGPDCSGSPRVHALNPYVVMPAVHPPWGRSSLPQGILTLHHTFKSRVCDIIMRWMIWSVRCYGEASPALQCG